MSSVEKTDVTNEITREIFTDGKGEDYTMLCFKLTRGKPCDIKFFFF